MTHPSAPVILSENPALPLLDGHPDHAPLILDGQDGISRQRFLTDLHELARSLPRSGHVFNLCRDRYHFLLGFCAALLREQVNLLPPNQQSGTLDDIASRFPDSYCLVDTPQSSLSLRQHVVTTGGASSASGTLPTPLLPATQLAAIAFTSGSTGTPSAHPKHWGTLAATARLLAKRLALTGPVLATVPPQHMYGLEMTTFMVLQGGATLLRDTPFFPAEICGLMARQSRPCTLVTTPIHLRSLVQAELPLPAASRILSATAPLDRSLADSAAQRFQTRVEEIYGCTEAGSLATRNTLESPQWHLLDSLSLTQTDTGHAVQAPHLPEEAPLQDTIALHSASHFSLLGRQSDMINVAGKRESLANLTLKLQQLDGVDDAVVFMPPERENTTTRPAALVVSELALQAINARLATLLDPVFVPRPIRKVRSLPRNETGKLTRQALHRLWEHPHEN